MQAIVEEIVREVVKQIEDRENTVLIEASGRHVHLNREAVESLFGEGYQLTKVRDLSQPGQYVCKERVTIAGPKGQFSNVVILGPERGKTQVEVSLTDARMMGIHAPVRESGDIEKSAPVTIMYKDKSIVLKEGLIVAKRHIHMTPEDARKNNVTNGQIVKVKTYTSRPLIFDDVIIRVSDRYSTAMHIDYDEANACGFASEDRGKIIL